MRSVLLTSLSCLKSWIFHFKGQCFLTGGETKIKKCEKTKHNHGNIAVTCNNNDMEVMDQDKKSNNI